MPPELQILLGGEAFPLPVLYPVVVYQPLVLQEIIGIGIDYGCMTGHVRRPLQKHCHRTQMEISRLQTLTIDCMELTARWRAQANDKCFVIWAVRNRIHFLYWLLMYIYI